VIGTLILLVAYLLATAGAVRMLWGRGSFLVPIWQIIVPIAGALVLLATLYYNLDFDAPKATRWNYYTAAIWIAIGVAIIVALPGLSRRVGDKLSADEGLVESETGGAAVPAD
jgi:amino acid transporter